MSRTQTTMTEQTDAIYDSICSLILSLRSSAPASVSRLSLTCTHLTNSTI